jgi:hypothetical protein
MEIEPEHSPRAELLFPTLLDYEPPRGLDFARYLHHRVVSALCCTLGFSVLVVCALVSRIPNLVRPTPKRPLDEIENTRKEERQQELSDWKAKQQNRPQKQLSRK